MITPPSASLIYVEKAKNDAVYANTYSLEVRNIGLEIEIVDYAQRNTLAASLRANLRPGVSGDLVATVDGVDYSMTCEVQSITPKSGQPTRYTAILQTGTSAWRAVSPTTATWSLAQGGGMTKTITVEGTVETRLCATLTPTGAQQTGLYVWQSLYQLPNVPGRNFGLRPWCLTIDTAALVSTGKMRADCYDLRMVIDGQETRRYIVNPNTSTTKVWFNANIGAGYVLELKTGISNSETVTELAFKGTANNLAYLTAMPARGIIYHGTEWFEYSGKNLKKYTLTISKRGVLGTTQQAHIAGDLFYYVQHVIYIVYGYASATNPAASDSHYDDDKPVFDLAQSDNTKWVYTAATKFYDPALPNRPGSWTPFVSCKGKVSKAYNIQANAESGYPALGMLIGTWKKSGSWKAENATIAWQLYCAGGIYRVTATGRKYRSGVQYPDTAALQRSNDRSTWYDGWTETTPTTAALWEDLAAHNNVSMADMYWIQMILDGGLTKKSNLTAYLEILTCTVEFTTTTLPSGTILGEMGNYALNMKITNTTNGDAISLTYPMLLNKSLVVDGEDFEITYDNVNAHNALVLNEEGRDVWIRLLPGENTLEAAADDVGTLTVSLSYYPRRI